MRTIKLKAQSGSCDILVGESIANLQEYCKEGKVAIITDANVRRLHGAKFPKAPVIEIGLGEGNKTLDTVQEIYGKFLEMELERNSLVIGIGGGIVCDIAGFAAATYARGARCGFVPTTLIAQADAAVGGKNGVNLQGYKNLVGTIRQPEFVLCDFELLKTLPPREFVCGFAEVIKHAAIADAALFSYLEGHLAEALAFKRPVIEKAIHDSLLVKKAIVEADEKESNSRMKLNFGHTVGHAVEKCLKLPHGEAVAIGMVAEANLSCAKGMITAKDAERVAALLKKAGLPVALPEGKVDAALLLDAVKKDKKRKGESIRMSLLAEIGKAAICEVEIGEIEGVLNDLC
ncbi:MAG: 3-dehydroquinate synthase [Candidatus Micrarchaeia archaeon]|jgi:3-dehydroquinate synthase